MTRYCIVLCGDGGRQKFGRIDDPKFNFERVGTLLGRRDCACLDCPDALVLLLSRRSRCVASTLWRTRLPRSALNTGHDASHMA